MKPEITAVRIVLDALLTHLELLAESENSRTLDDLINTLDEANALAGELE